MAKQKRSRTSAAIDKHVGAVMRERRIMLGLTQQQLANMIGVTYQQAHKYERGINRVSAGRLYEIARVLAIPILSFYEGVVDDPKPVSDHERIRLEIARNSGRIRNVRRLRILHMISREYAEEEKEEAAKNHVEDFSRSLAPV